MSGQPPEDPEKDPEKVNDDAIDGVNSGFSTPRTVSISGDGDSPDGVIEARRSKHTTKFDRLSGDSPALFGKRPHLAKSGREIANTAAEMLYNENPEWVDDRDDLTFTEVLKFVEGLDGGSVDPKRIRKQQTTTLCDLLSKGLTFREAVTFYLYEYGGLTLREIYHVDEGKQRSFSKDDDRQAERNVAATIQSAAEKLGWDVDVALD